ncbi:MAG: hypothetical protein M1821_009324 [Bathelium mastoideum]|nr:MAG: hypothetical protein M1821_009324 [Bathelium mastoideum]
MDPGKGPIFSEGSDHERLSSDVGSLLTEAKWVLSNDHKGVEKGFQFKGFNKAWVGHSSYQLEPSAKGSLQEFMNLVAADCKKQKHHPEWSNIYNKTRIRWTTHSPSGLSEKDITMARICDAHAESLGGIPITQVAETGVTGSSTTPGLEAGECCVPKRANKTESQ